MGRATIVSGGADGAYSIKVDGGKATQTARLAALAARLAALVGEIAYADGLAASGRVLVGILQAKQDDCIAAYADAARAVPMVDATLKKALSDFSSNLEKLNTELKKSWPTALALQRLKDEQAQLLKDQTYWANLKLETTLQAWCADLTEDATGEVATLEIPGEDKLVIISPAAPKPVADDGAITAREVQSGPQVFWNSAVLPGWQKWKPTYRRGTLTAINSAADTADVLLDDDVSSAQALGINQTRTLAGVPVVYMTCNTAAFEVGDRCVVKFTEQDWAKPKIVGFVNHPKSCAVILSGVTRGGDVVTLDVPPGSPPGTVGQPVLRSYKPTQNAWDYPLRQSTLKSPSLFNDEPRLAAGGAQYAGLNASSYSGLMARVVQILMGMGRPVPYDYKWALGHGVVLATDGTPWLLQISQADGVLATALPRVPGRTNSLNVAEAQAVALLGGLPSGVEFPTGAALAAAQTAGTVLTLASVAAMAPFFDKFSWAPWLGWSFDAMGREARHTCYTMVGGVCHGYQYQLLISISPGTGSSYSGSAVLAALTDGVLERVDTATYPLSFAPLSGDPAPLPVPVVASFTAPGTESPVFVRHDGTAFDVMRLRMQPQGSVHVGPVSIDVTNPGYISEYANNLSSYVVSDHKPEVRETSFGWSSLQASFIEGFGGMGPSDGIVAPPDVIVSGVISFWSFTSATGGGSRGPRCCAVVEGMRDGYVLFEYGGDEATTEYAGVTASFKPASVEPYLGPLPDQYTTQTGSTYLPNMNRTSIVRSASASDLVLAPETDVNTKIGEQLLWGNPQFNKLVPRGPMFSVRHSMFGDSAHTQHSASIWSVDSLLSGPQLDGISTPTAEVYNFIGYL